MGCWKSSLLAKKIPQMHVKNISDSNFNSNLFTLKAHVVLPSITCTGGLFLPPTTAFLYFTAKCGGPIDTCTVGWWYVVVVLYIDFANVWIPRMNIYSWLQSPSGLIQQYGAFSPCTVTVLHQIRYHQFLQACV